VTRVAIKGNRFAVSAEEEILIEVPVAAIAEYQREGCRRCVDYTAELADISIGGVGSSLGWSTVVIRSDAGEKIFESARKARVFDCKDLKTVDPGMNTIMKLSEKKKKQDASTYLRYM